jgi:hypothetical protein
MVTLLETNNKAGVPVNPKERTGTRQDFVFVCLSVVNNPAMRLPPLGAVMIGRHTLDQTKA